MTNSDSTPEVITIQIAKGYSCIVDSQDADLASYKWLPTIGHTSGPYAHRNIPTPKGYRGVPMHRVILGRKLGRALLPGESVDHIDRDGLNNRRSNLRLADHMTNAYNSKKRRDNKSGYKGVCWSIPGNCWRAYGKLNGKQIHLGYFDDPKEAHEAYKEFAREHYGEFARFE